MLKDIRMSRAKELKKKKKELDYTELRVTKNLIEFWLFVKLRVEHLFLCQALSKFKLSFSNIMIRSKVDNS